MPSKPTLNEDQKEVFKIIQRFLDSAADTLVLKGNAGTGKTFLMQYVGKWLNEQKHSFSMLASTGRAAAILRGKTGFSAKTVHSELYNFNRVEGAEDEISDDATVDKYGQMTMQFSLRKPDEEKCLYIVDESSMLSSEFSENDAMLSFGSGILMTDFFESVGNNKILFVGDPCQLPPVGQTFSPALDLDWLATEKRIAIAATLTKIERNESNNDILLLANSLRDLSLQNEWERFPRIPAKNRNNVTLHDDDEDLLKDYLQSYKEYGVLRTIAIARSNRQINAINKQTRSALYGTADLPLQMNDVLLVVQNNYSVPLTNGDFVMVSSMGAVNLHLGMHFLEVKVKSMISDDEFEMLISLDILYGVESNFSSEQQRMLMIDFSKRMNKKKIRGNSEAFKEKMRTDPYLNCLKVKYGYAVTCHKAQGGEWDFVYLFLDKKIYGMPKPEFFRWLYTAVTRTRKQLHLSKGWWIA